MFLKSFSSSLREALILGANYKYKSHSLDYSNKQDISVICELIGESKLIKLKLQEIINNKLQFFEAADVLRLSKAVNDKKNTTYAMQEQKYYSPITIAFTVLLLLSNIAESKICNFFGFAVGAGTIIFPLLYILSDVVTEVYGFTASRKTIWTGFCCTIFYSLFIYIVCLLPPSEHWEDQIAFEQIFLVSPRIVAGSIISYFIGELLNTTIIAFLKIKLQGRYFAIRAIFSTLVGSLLESFVFVYIAFFNRIPTSELLGMIALLTIVKVAYEIIVMPITIKFVNYLKQVEGLNVYEKPSLIGLIPQFLKIKS